MRGFTIPRGTMLLNAEQKTMKGIMFETIRTVALQQELRNCYANLCTLADGHPRGRKIARPFWKKQVKSVAFLNIYDLPLCAASLFAFTHEEREKERESARKPIRFSSWPTVTALNSSISPVARQPCMKLTRELCVICHTVQLVQGRTATPRL